MLVADRGSIGVVVQSYEIRPPKQHNLCFRGQHNVNGGLEMRRPSRGRPEAARRPIERAHKSAQLASAYREAGPAFPTRSRVATAGHEARTQTAFPARYKAKLPANLHLSTTWRGGSES